MLSVMVTFASRALLIALFFPFSALDKWLNGSQAIDQAAQVFPRRSWAIAAIVAGVCVEVGMSLAVLSGVADRLAALALAAYCMATAFGWKRFWSMRGFRLKGASAARETFWDFMKNLSVAGGFLMGALGPNAAIALVVLDHPFASTHP